MSVDREKARAIAEQLRWNRMPSLLDAAEIIEDLLAETTTPEPDPTQQYVRERITAWHQRNYTVIGNSAAWDDLFHVIMGAIAKTDATRLHEARVEGAKAMQIAALFADYHNKMITEVIRRLSPADAVKSIRTEKPA